MSETLQKRLPITRHYSYTFFDAIISTILVFICLIALKPTFISELNFSTQLLLCTVVSLIVFIVLFFKWILVSKMARSGKWTLKMDLITLFSVLFTISILLQCLSPLVLKMWFKVPIVLDWEYYLKIIGLVYLIGILLYFASLSAKFLLFSFPETNQTFEEIISLEEAQIDKPNPLSTPLVLIEGKNQGEYLEIQQENLVCISTNGHYIDIFVMDQDSQKLKKIVYRNTILSIAESLEEYDDFIHCHRSHLINISHVSKLIGNSKKMELLLKNTDLKIPISRSKVSLLTRKMKI